MGETLEIFVKEDVKVGEAVGVKVTEEQKRFLERVKDTLLKFSLDEVYISFIHPSFPGAVTFKFRKKD